MEDFEVVGDNELWINTKHYGQYIYNIKTRLFEKKSDLSAISLFRANNFIVLQSFSGSLVFYDLDKKEVYNRFNGHKEFVTDLNFHPDGDKLFLKPIMLRTDGTGIFWTLVT